MGDVWIPAESDGTMWVHFTPHDGSRYVSAAAVLAGEIAPDRLERRLVLVGVTALGFGDQHVTPLHESVPGVEVHAATPEGRATYESGVDPVGTGWAQSQVRYLSFAFLYVVFAVDAVYLFPWALVLRDADLGVASLVEVLVFVGVVLLGLVHAARRGLLRWDLA